MHRGALPGAGPRSLARSPGALCEAGQDATPSRKLARPGRPGPLGLLDGITSRAVVGRLVLARPGRPVSPGRIGAGRVKGAKRRRRRGPLTREAPSGHPTGDRERPARQRKVVVGPRGLDDLDLLGPATTDQDGLAGLELAHRVGVDPMPALLVQLPGAVLPSTATALERGTASASRSTATSRFLPQVARHRLLQPLCAHRGGGCLGLLSLFSGIGPGQAR